MSVHAVAAYERDAEPHLFLAVYDLLQRTYHEVRKLDGTPYNPTYSYRSLYNNGGREAVTRAILKSTPEGFGTVIEAGRFDLSYEWFVQNPVWRFATNVRQRAWDRLNPILRS
jgi:hypothetical protein